VKPITTLPRVAASGAPIGERKDEEKVSILIVDDLPEKLLVFRTVLEELNQELVFVKSGREALREVLQREFAVILLDVNMPDIDGFETAALLRQYKRSADTPIIFITSYADEIQTERGYSMGAVDYILSPVVPHILRSKVRVFVRLFAMQRQIRQQANADAAIAAADAARRVAESNDHRSALLAQASHALNGSLEFGVTTRAFTELLLPHLASVALLLPVDGEEHAPSALLAMPGQGASELPFDAIAPPVRTALRDAMRTKRRVMLPGDVVGALALQSASSGPAAEADDVEPLVAAVAVPLLNGDRLHGALLVAASSAEQLADWPILDDLAARAASALENARLYGTLQTEIVERRAVEAELQEEARRKDEFLAMLSHELRNPLAPIRTAVEVIRRTTPPDAKSAWASDIMVRQLGQMTRLIDELLDVARISHGKIVLSREKVDLNAVIGESVETVQPAIDARAQRLLVVPFAEPVWLQGDPARLAQIISNLLHNASKYSENGTVIELRAHRDGNGAVIRVLDQGMGMDPRLLPHVFDLFTQGARGLDRRQGGLGIGLTLARRLTQLHGGTIEARSEGVGKGSEFIVRLPCIGLVRNVEAAPPPPVKDDAPGCRVLIVDDNQDAALSVAMLLQMGGHETETAHDGAQALDLAASFRPDVVVLDIGLPVLDGYQVARQLRRAPDTRDALLLALTGYGQQQDEAAATAAGFNRHFIKPADIDALLACIASWSRQRAAGHRTRAINGSSP